MNLRKASSVLGKLAFRALRGAATILPGGKISAFGSGSDRISAIHVINLDRQPARWRRVTRELARFRTAHGLPLTSIVRRFAAIDARDARSVAATADVDPNYRIADQLYVQPDDRLTQAFDVEEPVRMTRQETAVARSHIEVWKRIATGPDDYALVLEDDIWFRPGAAIAIDRGWRAALGRSHDNGKPMLLYLSYSDADGTAERAEVSRDLFRPVRGLWFLSGYVLSREGAAALLKAMPVIGPVDMWINYRFEELGALALTSPAIMQRQDGSDNSYSMLPYLARAGIVDATVSTMSPDRPLVGHVLAWTDGGPQESLAMALAMLGQRVRVFDADEGVLGESELSHVLASFDALVNPPLTKEAVEAVCRRTDTKFVMEPFAAQLHGIDQSKLPAARTAIVAADNEGDRGWEQLCALLGVSVPAEGFPDGAAREFRLFRDDRAEVPSEETQRRGAPGVMDDSPWILPPHSHWPSEPRSTVPRIRPKKAAHAGMELPSPWFQSVSETFPGNLASFTHDGISYGKNGADIAIKRALSGSRPYQSAAMASTETYRYGRFEAEIKAAPGSGLVTGFFLHRRAPRQEVDIELLGSDPRRMLVNVYFNPGDDEATVEYGYRGTPCHIDLGFDSTLDYHLYAIDWYPDRILWWVDNRIVHERTSWSPTPVPHLPMRLHANLWAPRSMELAGQVDQSALPSSAWFRNVSVSNLELDSLPDEDQSPSLDERPVRRREADGVS